MKNNILFNPLSIKNVTLKNRIVMAPMTRSFSVNGVPGEDVAEYYKRRAQGEVGLIITEGTVIDRPGSSNDTDVPHFYGEEALNGWKAVVDAVHKEEGKIIPQLWHMGIVSKLKKENSPFEFEGPSGLIMPDVKGGHTMTEEDIQDTIRAFAEAALNAKKLGFDGVELHGAHGYLIDQFFWEGMNKRKDQWGGNTIKERNQFAIAIIKAVREAVGEDFLVGIRLSQWKQQDYGAKIAKNPEEMREWLLPLSEAGIDLFHCSQRRFWEPEFEGSNLNFAGWANKITGKPSISVGSVGLSGEFTGAFKGEGSSPESIDELLKRMNNNEFDLVAVGRALLADPEWLVKIKAEKIDELKGFTKESLMELY